MQEKYWVQISHFELSLFHLSLCLSFRHMASAELSSTDSYTARYLHNVQKLLMRNVHRLIHFFSFNLQPICTVMLHTAHTEPRWMAAQGIPSVRRPCEAGRLHAFMLLKYCWSRILRETLVSSNDLKGWWGMIIVVCKNVGKIREPHLETAKSGNRG